ncbi:MAG: hypothetical protein QXL54_02525 [Candidatus Bathyarchaeia archaeon]
MILGLALGSDALTKGFPHSPSIVEARITVIAVMDKILFFNKFPTPCIVYYEIINLKVYAEQLHKINPKNSSGFQLNVI